MTTLSQKLREASKLVSTDSTSARLLLVARNLASLGKMSKKFSGKPVNTSPDSESPEGRAMILKPLMSAVIDLKTHVNILNSQIEKGKNAPDRTEFRNSLYEVKNMLSRIKDESFGRTVQGLIQSVKLYEKSRGRELM